MGKPTDDYLLLASGRGDQNAFKLLMQRHHRAIISFIHRFLTTADRATVEDLAQHVFLSAWRYAPSFQPRAKVRTWLFRIATNACLNSRRYEQSRSPITATAPLRADEQDPEDLRAVTHLTGGERAEQVRTAVAGLPPNQRAVVVLRYLHEFSYAEMADIMATSTSAVDSLLHRARRALYEKLGPSEK